MTDDATVEIDPSATGAAEPEPEPEPAAVDIQPTSTVHKSTASEV
jgi:hypothetical protein